MPILPENKARYPSDWKAISLRIRHERAENMCECTGQCGDDHELNSNPAARCCAPNGAWVSRFSDRPGGFYTMRWWTPGEGWPEDGQRPIKIVLTVAHLDHTPENCGDANLLAMCQRCHLRYDREHHAETRRSRRDAKSGQQGMF